MNIPTFRITKINEIKYCLQEEGEDSLMVGSESDGDWSDQSQVNEMENCNENKEK